MKIRSSLLASAVLLMVASGAGYGMAVNSGRPELKENTGVEGQLIANREELKVDREVIEKTTLAMPGNLAVENERLSGSLRRDIKSDEPNLVPLDISTEFRNGTPETALEDIVPALPSSSDKESVVTEWLEARTAREAAFAKAKPRETATEVTPAYNEGGGWCDWCGCWMRHGCDPNGNCGIGHAQVCGPDSCVLHPQGPCYSSGLEH